jgi:hypothetical protein
LDKGVVLGIGTIAGIYPGGFFNRVISVSLKVSVRIKIALFFFVKSKKQTGFLFFLDNRKREQKNGCKE